MTNITSKSGHQITFRQPQSSDFKTLFQYAKTIEKEDTFILLNPQEPLPKKEEQEYLIADLKKIKNGQKVVTLALDNQTVIGSCGVEKKGRRSQHIGVLGIALLKPYRSDGIGKKLIQHTITQAQKKLNLQKIILTCMANNKIAIKFYLQLGFKKFECC